MYEANQLIVFFPVNSHIGMKRLIHRNITGIKNIINVTILNLSIIFSIAICRKIALILDNIGRLTLE